MSRQHTEYAFEAAIEHHLTTAGGYVTGDRDGFDPHQAIFPSEVVARVGWLLPIGVVLVSAAVTGKMDVRGEVG